MTSRTLPSTDVPMKPGLEKLPPKMINLPVDGRGYPVPWFVAWVDGKPEFRAMDPKKLADAIGHRLCWVCGGKLGTYLVFTVGPMCGINRTSGEPPSHKDCASWSARNCPFLSNPDMVRREDDVVNNAKLAAHSEGSAISRNPGVTLLWTTRNYQFFELQTGKVIITMDEPTAVEWWYRGRTATRREVVDSIESGLPALENAARVEPGGLELLERMKDRFWKLLPATA